MGVPQRLGNDDVDELADGCVGGVAEKQLRPGVPTCDSSGLVGSDRRVRHRSMLTVGRVRHRLGSQLRRDGRGELQAMSVEPVGRGGSATLIVSWLLLSSRSRTWLPGSAVMVKMCVRL
jgi:hypothetical protein